MKTRNVFRILSVILTIITTLAITSPAFADKPVQAEETWDFTYPLDWSTCGFEIMAHEYGQFRMIQWLDENGQPVRETDIFGNLKQEWSANGKTVDVQYQGPIHAHAQYFTDKLVVTSKLLGTNLMVTIPGYGRIFGGGGQVVETYTLALDGTLISYSLDGKVGNINFDWGPICDYLGPD